MRLVKNIGELAELVEVELVVVFAELEVNCVDEIGHQSFVELEFFAV